MSFLLRQESAIMESSRVAAAHEWEVSQRRGDLWARALCFGQVYLSNDAMARDHELGGVGDCGGNQAVKAHRDKRHMANRADKEARKEKVLKK